MAFGSFAKIKNYQTKLMLTLFIVTLTLLAFTWSRGNFPLKAFSSLLLFDSLYILTAFIPIALCDDETSRNSNCFPYDLRPRAEVLAVFTSSAVLILAAVFIVKETVEFLLEGEHNSNTYNSPLFSVLTYMIHLINIYLLKNTAFDLAIQAASSSWLQEHIADLCHALCRISPPLSRLLLPRINPLALLGNMGLFAVLFSDHIQSNILAPLFIAFMIWGTMMPLALLSGRILMQVTPSHLITQLDRCLHEASRIDGVLELKNEHFWALDFTKLIGSVHVRIRRDANEQLVLAHVYYHLSTVVHNLTVHMCKDEPLLSSHLHTIPAIHFVNRARS